MLRRLISPAFLTLWVGLGAVMPAVTAHGDTVRLTNGDTLNAQVVSLDEETLRLESEILGEVTLPRDKVASIHLGDRKPAAAPADGEEAAPIEAAKPTEATAGSPDIQDAIVQLRQQGGVSPEMMQQLRQQVPMLALPEVREYFNETIAGLVSGQGGMENLRQDAKRARDELQRLKQDLGPRGGQALSGYLSLIDKFLRETEPPKADEQAEDEAKSGS